MNPRPLLALVCWTALAAACREDPTEIVVYINSDVRDLDAVHLVLRHDGEAPFFDRRYPLRGAGARQLPGEVTVTAKTPELRSRACTLMSLMGNTALLPQMKVMAASDPAKDVDPSRRRGAEVWVSYPVRETCQTAIDELRVKALTTQR